MKTRNLLIAALLGTTGLAVHLYDPNLASAQSATAGAIQGTVVDQKDGSALAGVTVIATSPALAQTQTAITDEKGTYKINDLPPGDYLVTFYYADITVEHSGIHVGIGKTTPVFQKINQAQAGGEVVHVTATAPTIDPTSTTQGITIDQNYIKNIPVPGRTFESALGAAAGSQGDALGVSFSGSSSLENQYFVDGVNTTNLTYGTVGSPVINDFIEEIEVITGGYNAEYGRATGGIVNVVTKSGSNEFKGSIFGYWQPGALTAAAKVTPVNASSIDLTPNTVYNADFGFELGGPIVKDKLWFFVGFAPQFASTDYTRTIKRETDCRVIADAAHPAGNIPGLSTCEKANGDGTPDVDPRTGFYITDNVDSEIRNASGTNYNIIGKINYAATPEHQGQLTVEALPSSQRNPGLLGPELSGGGYKQDSLTTDISAKWTSKFNDNKTEVEAIVGYHRDSLNTNALDPGNADYGNGVPSQVLVQGDLNRWGPGFGESATTNSYQGCKDGNASTDDPYPLITNCPMTTEPYYIGGPGAIIRDVEQRRSAKLSITHRVKAAGSHEFKAGIDAEDNRSEKARIFSGSPMYGGGGQITNFVDGQQIEVQRYVQLTTMDNTDPRFNQTCTTPNTSSASSGSTAANINFKCAFLGGTPGDPGTTVQSSTFNWAAYVRDSWQIQPNLTLNVGLRYEEQRLHYADFLQNTVDPLTGETLGTNALTLTGNWAPRIGLLYDWTKEGRSKIYAHWGRFYESVPMDINDRSFGGEVFYQQYYSTTSSFGAGNPCGLATANHAAQIGGPDGLGCMQGTGTAPTQRLIGASGELIAPGTQSQYMDEIIAGFEYEIVDDLKVGVSYQNRSLGRIIEDVSTDGANTYIISNPGEWSQDEENKLNSKITMTDDPKEKARLQNELKLYQGIRIFDKARRDYNALQFTLTRRFSKKLYVQGSYTFSRTEGNYPGLFQSTNGQVDPNISSQYDLVELLENHIGALPQDRPHYIKLDGYYTFDLKKAGDLTIGIRFRALSGVPENALAGHYLYGPNESYLLPQGSLGRTDFDHGLDVHIGYGRNLSKNMKLEIFADIYNVYNRQGTASVDDNYAPYYKLAATNGATGEQQNANPVSGGTYSDLIFVKELDLNGKESAVPIGRNPNFHNVTSRYAPLSARLGARLTF